MMTRGSMMAMAMAAATLALPGCKTLVCGEGTIEESGECVQGVDPGDECGPGTYLDTTTGQCERSDFNDAGFGKCDPATTVVVYDDAGVPQCRGTGTMGCPPNITCTAPQAGKISICGRLYDLESSELFDDGDDSNGTPSAGVEVRIYEPLGFANNPSGTTPLAIVYPDPCGIYTAEVQAQPSGYIAFATEDVDGSADDLYQLTGVAIPTAPGGTYNNQITMVTKISTLDLWDTSAGRMGANSFKVTGVYVPIFLEDPGTMPIEPFGATPIADVQVTEGITVDANRDFYFSDPEPNIRRSIDPMQNATGANGTGIMINTGLGNHSGTGGEPSGCSWPSTLSAAVPGVVFVQERIAENCP